MNSMVIFHSYVNVYQRVPLDIGYIYKYVKEDQMFIIILLVMSPWEIYHCRWVYVQTTEACSPEAWNHGNWIRGIVLPKWPKSSGE